MGFGGCLNRHIWIYSKGRMCFDRFENSGSGHDLAKSGHDLAGPKNNSYFDFKHIKICAHLNISYKFL